MCLEHRATGRLGRVSCEDELDTQSGTGRLQLPVVHTGGVEQREGLREGLARNPALRLVLASPPDAVMLLRDVDQLEEECEGPQHGGLSLVVESGDRLAELVARSSRTCLTCKRPDALLVIEEALSPLLDENAPEQIAEQPHVRAKSGVGGHAPSLENTTPTSACLSRPALGIRQGSPRRRMEIARGGAPRARGAVSRE